jgi:hypothetical protein
MTLRETAALATFGISHRLLLRNILCVLLDRPLPDESAMLPVQRGAESRVAKAAAKSCTRHKQNKKPES